MPMTYAQVQDRVEQWLQDTTNATYDTTELGMWIENGLKEIAKYDPVLVVGIYQIESRKGTETAGTTSKLTDTTKSQFLSTDPTLSKVVHNVTEDTWAVVTGYTSTSVLSISNNIMNIGDKYEIYNKRCFSNKQIFLGSPSPYLDIVSLEYPMGTKRDFHKISRDIVEIDISEYMIQDSNSTLDPPKRVDALIKFAMPHVLSQLTDWEGELTALALAGATTVAIDGMGASETIEVGEMFNLQDHKTTYVVTTEVTMSSGAGALVFFPGLEANSSDSDDISFVPSTLQPIHENILIEWVCGTALMSEAMRHINAIPKGGSSVGDRYYSIGDRMVQKAEAKMRQLVDVNERATYTYSRY